MRGERIAPSPRSFISIDARAIDRAVVPIERMTPVLISVENLPGQLERRLGVVVAAGDIDAPVAPVLADIAAPDEEVSTNDRRSTLVVPAEIEASALAGRNDDVAQELHIVIAAPEAGLGETFRERVRHT